MASVKTWSQLEKALQQARDKALKGASEKAKDLVKDRIDKDVYSVYSPNSYERTYDLKESVEPSDIKSNGNVSEIKISHNEDKIRSTGNQHRSVVDGKSSASSIAEIVHNGKTGAIGQRGYWRDAPWYDNGDAFAHSRPYMDNAKKEMKDGKYKDFMIEQLKKQGFDAK
ncbi:MAG TPA: hypothetical protein VFC79_02055 [Tissierellaceae bacterium]|nr:hypothetical protein [Tissierellaceae bacterium]